MRLSLEVRVGLLILGALVTFGLFCWFIAGDSIEQEAQDTDRAYRECVDRGGMWTPVGGRQYTTVWGCVFPPRSP